MTAFEAILEVWPVIIIVTCFAIMMFLRLLAYYRRREIALHETVREVYRVRKEYDDEIERQVDWMRSIIREADHDMYAHLDEDDDRPTIEQDEEGNDVIVV